MLSRIQILVLLAVIVVAHAAIHDVTAGERRARFDTSNPLSMKLGKKGVNDKYLELQYTEVKGIQKDANGNVVGSGNKVLVSNLTTGLVPTSEETNYYEALVQGIFKVASETNVRVQIGYYLAKSSFTYNKVTVDGATRCVTPGTVAPTCSTSRQVGQEDMKFAFYIKNFPFQPQSTHFRLTALITAVNLADMKIYYNGDKALDTIASMAGKQFKDVTFENDAYKFKWAWEQTFNANGASAFKNVTLTLDSAPSNTKSAYLHLDFPRAGWDAAGQWMLYDPTATMTEIPDKENDANRLTTSTWMIVLISTIMFFMM